MKNLGKKLIGWMICLSMAVAMLPGMTRKAKAEEVIEENGIKYEKIADDKVIVKKCNEMVIVDIPSEVEGFKVVGIDADAFRGCESTRTVVISSNVSKIPDRVFVGCNQLVSIQVNANNSDFATVDGVLFSKDKTRLLCCPAGYKSTGSSGEYIIPETVLTIEARAFYGCSNLTSITLPSGLTSIGSSAFSECSGLTSIMLPNGLTTISNEAFANCINLSTVWVSEDKKDMFGNTSIFPGLSNVITYNVEKDSFPKDLVYNGSDQADAIKALISVKQGNTSLSEGEDKAYQVLFSSDGGKYWSEECINAGTYQIKLAGCNTEAGYVGEVTDAKWTFTISSLTLSSNSVTAGFGNTTFTYDGENQIERIKNALCVKNGTKVLSPSSDYAVTFYDDSSNVDSIVNAGDYIIVITGKGNCSESKTLYAKINPSSDMTVSWKGSTYEYDGTEKAITNTPTANVTDGTNFYYAFEGGTAWTSDLSSLTKTEPGVYTLIVKAENPNYHTATATATLNISQKALTITTASASKEYDGSALSKDSFTYTELVVGDKIESVTITGSQMLAGSSDNIPGVAVIKNASDEDVTAFYVITYEKGKLEVTKKKITITAGSDSKEYDGTPLTNNSYTNTDLAPGDEIKAITITGSRTVTGNCDNIPSAAIIKNAAGVDVTECYDITYEDGMLSIEPAKATIKVDSASKMEGESEPAFTGTVEGLVKEGDLGTVSYKRTNSDEAPGAYKGVISATYTENPNYDVTVVNGDFTIAAKEKETYKTVSGAGGSYTQENSGTLTFSFKSTENDASTFDHFKGVEVDGKAVPEKDNSGRVNWTAKRGSVILELQPAFLDTLSAGEHLIKVIFDDGESSAIFKILEAIATPTVTPTVDTTPTVTPTVDATPTVTPAADTAAAVSPSLDATPTVTPAADTTPVTGDAANPFLWIAMILMSMAGVAVMIEKKRGKA